MPVSDQYEVTSYTSDPDEKPSTIAGSPGSIRRTRWSAGPESAPLVVTLAPPSLDESVVVWPGNVFISTYGQFAGGEPLTIVKWVVKRAVLPAASTSVP